MKPIPNAPPIPASPALPFFALRDLAVPTQVRLSAELRLAHYRSQIAKLEAEQAAEEEVSEVSARVVAELRSQADALSAQLGALARRISPGPHGPHLMRLPTHSACVGLLAMIKPAIDARQGAKDPEAVEAAEALAEGARGAVIGSCWRHPGAAFEAARSAFPSLTEYGRAVIEELHEAGYTRTQILALAEACSDAITKSLPEFELPGEADFSSDLPPSSSTS